MRGGLVFFRGAGAEARSYLESDHSHADEYYLENGTAVAEWTALDTQGDVLSTARLDGEAYQGWVDWRDPDTGALRGTPRDEQRVREDGSVRPLPASPRFVEMTVNCDKSLSVAAALDPRVSKALDAAQASAVASMNAYMATNSVTRVGPRGGQRFVPAERLESVAVVHRSSRAGDPHRHVHVQWSTRVFAEGQWRSLHTAATLKQQGALRGVGEAAINGHDGLRTALAEAGFTFDASTGKVTNLAAQTRLMSKRATQIERNVDRFESEWRRANPGREPDAAQRRRWDQQAWAFERPRKRKTNEHPESKWIAELRDAGLQVDGFAATAAPRLASVLELDRARLADVAVRAAESRASAWSIADLEGHVGVAVAAHDIAASSDEVRAYVRDVAEEIAASLPRLPIDVEGHVPDWVRHYTSEHVMHVERDLRERLLARGLASGLAPDSTPIEGLNAQQAEAARALATSAPLVVVEGAAGSGKTTMLGAARDLAAADGRRLIVVAPTLRAAQEATAATGVQSSSAHKLAHEHGFRWGEDGRWSRLAVGDVDASTGAVFDGPDEGFRLDPSARIVVDEAGMADHDLAHALVTIADETGASLALVGDRQQLPAVGRGGVLDMAVAAHPRPLDMAEVHRFREPGYADLSHRMREREDAAAIFDDLHARGNLVIHGSELEARDAIARDAVAKALAGASVAVAVTSNEQATEINALVQDAHARAGHTRQPGREISGTDGLSLRVGDRVMTRRNDSELGVANRDTWAVERVHRDGSVSVREGARTARLPREYVDEHVHLAYASTVYGVQGATVDYAHGIVAESTSAQALYVAATRGREHNAVHIVAGDVDQARATFVDAMGRESGDRGLDSARDAAARDLSGVLLPHDVAQPAQEDAMTDPTREHEHRDAAPAFDAALRAERIDAEARAHAVRLDAWQRARGEWQRRHPGETPDTYRQRLVDAEREAAAATADRRREEQTVGAAAVRDRERDWAAGYADVERARQASESANPFRRRGAEQEHEDARRAFRARHGLDPAPAPGDAVKERWTREATAPGASGTLDAARQREQVATEQHAALASDQPKFGARPTAPQPGSPRQERARDAAYAQQREARERTAGRRRQQQPPTKAPQPGIER